MAGLRRRVQEAERSRLLDIFARIARPPLVASLELQVAARHVETGRIAIDVVERRLRFDRPATLCNRDHQYRLVEAIHRFWQIREGRPRWAHGFTPIGEEKGRRAVGILAQLAR